MLIKKINTLGKCNNIKKKMEKSTTRLCVKVSNLRKVYDYSANFEKWLKNKENVYCGRSGRIFVDKKYFRYDGSKWANPYTLKNYSINDCIALYRKYIMQKIRENPKEYDIDELRGKTLGCWCDSRCQCHVDVLISIIDQTD